MPFIEVRIRIPPMLGILILPTNRKATYFLRAIRTIGKPWVRFREPLCLNFRFKLRFSHLNCNIRLAGVILFSASGTLKRCDGRILLLNFHQVTSNLLATTLPSFILCYIDTNQPSCCVWIYVEVIHGESDYILSEPRSVYIRRKWSYLIRTQIYRIPSLLLMTLMDD